MTGVSLAGTQLRVNEYAMQDHEWNDVKVISDFLPYKKLFLNLLPYYIVSIYLIGNVKFILDPATFDFNGSFSFSLRQTFV